MRTPTPDRHDGDNAAELARPARLNAQALLDLRDILEILRGRQVSPNVGPPESDHEP